MNPRDLHHLLADLAATHAEVTGAAPSTGITDGQYAIAFATVRQQGRALLLADTAAKRTWTETCLWGQALRAAEDALELVGADDDLARELAEEFMAAYRSH